MARVMSGITNTTSARKYPRHFSEILGSKQKTAIRILCSAKKILQRNQEGGFVVVYYSKLERL